MQDAELLRAFQGTQSESAFEELVKRYGGLVYSTAYRRLGAAHLAEETTQTVFCVLARKAPTIGDHASLAGWLYRATCLTSAKLLRTERRRRARELEAARMAQNDLVPEDLWQRLAPMVNTALDSLGEQERLVILLRFFLRKPMREIGNTLGVSEDAAKMRVSRALDKLRQFFAKRGVACSSAALALLLADKSIQASPATLFEKIVATRAAGSGVTALVPGLSVYESFVLMAKIKAKSLVIATLVTGALLTTGLFVFESILSSRAGKSGGSFASNNPAGGESLDRAIARWFGQAHGGSNGPRQLKGATDQLWAVLRAKPLPGARSYPSQELIEAIQRFGAQASAAFAILKEAATDPDPEIRRKAIAGMGVICKSVPEVAQFIVPSNVGETLASNT